MGVNQIYTIHNRKHVGIFQYAPMVQKRRSIISKNEKYDGQNINCDSA